MLDLFGNKLKKDLEILTKENTELKDKVDELNARLAKQEEKVKKAMASKQFAEEEVNEARRKIESLENEVVETKPKTPDVTGFRIVRNISRSELEELLLFLGSSETKFSSLLTMYTCPEEPAIEQKDENVGRYIDPDALSLIGRIESETGKVVFYAFDLIRAVIVPPVPLSASKLSIDRNFNIQPLLNTIGQDISICVLIAHAGESFIGILGQKQFMNYEIITTSVMGKHSKGGWSQKRFERLVEEDIRHHAQKVKEKLSSMTDAHDIDLLIVSGEKSLVNQIVGENINIRTISRQIDAAISKQNLDTIFREVWSSRLYIL